MARNDQLIRQHKLLQLLESEDRTVQADPGAIVATAQGVNRTRDKLLAGSTLAVNENRFIGWCHASDLFADRFNRIALANDRARSVGLDRRRGAPNSTPLECFGY